MLKKLLAVSAVLYATCAFATVDANQATQNELDAIKGIGPALSERIVAQRKKSAFTDWADLITRVHGVGNTSAAKFSADGLTVNGKSYQGAPTDPGHAVRARASVDAGNSDKSPALTPPRPRPQQ